MKKSIVVLFILVSSVLYAAPKVNIFYEYTPNGYTLFAANDESFPVEVTLNLDLNNLKVAGQTKTSLLVPPNSTKFKLVDLVAVSRLRGYSFDFTFEAKKTDLDAIPQDSITIISENSDVIESDTKIKILKPTEIKAAVIANTSQTIIEKQRSNMQVGIKVENDSKEEIEKHLVEEEIIQVSKIAEEKQLLEEANAESARLEEESKRVDDERIAMEVKIQKEKRQADELKKAEVAIVAKKNQLLEKSVIRNPIYEVTGKYDAAFVYNLPFKKGATYTILQGYQGDFSHEDKYALDFLMPENSEVYATREGVVIRVVAGNTKGCGSKTCAQFDNFIVIVHDDGTYAKYAHLKNSEVVKGDSIKKDQLIGYSGSTGWTDNPILHFEVFFQKEDGALQTVKTNFLKGDGNDYGILGKGQWYTRAY